MARWPKGKTMVCGVDEAGRGPLAGPVVVAAVILDGRRPIAGLADSKTLDAPTREALYALIVRRAAVSVVMIGPSRIDAMNIRAATLWGMARAVAALPEAPQLALFDGRDVPVSLAVEGRAVVKGDARSAPIAAASIVAKVTRDRLMVALSRHLPHYGFDRHKGYATPEHQAALFANGPSVHHRRSFAPVRLAAEAFAATSVAPCQPMGSSRFVGARAAEGCALDLRLEGTAADRLDAAR